MQILSPAGSPEALRAAVYGGADAVYFGAFSFNARAGAQNFTEDAIREGIRFCHERGVEVHATLNTLVSDRELDDALAVAEIFVDAGADALIVQDPGLARALRERTDIPLHASTQLTAHSLDGVRFLADLGFSRVVLSRELSRDNIAFITAHAPVEIETFVHGALCMCYSGQCYMSSVIGLRSGNRGKCAQPCRLPYRGGYELSLSDMCLLRDVKDIESLGVACVKIEGRMKSPAYVGAVTRAYADAKRGKPFDPDEEKRLADVFSRGGFTRAYYLGEKSPAMFGVRSETTETPRVPDREYKRFTLDFSVTSEDGETLRICAATSDGYAAEASVRTERAQKRVTTEDEILSRLSRLGDTVYTVGTFDCALPPDRFVPDAALNAARRDLLASLTEMRLIRTHFYTEKPVSLPPRDLPSARKTEGYFLDPAAIPPSADRLDRVWIPLEKAQGKLFEKLALRFGARLGVALPVIVTDDERLKTKTALLAVRDAGVTDVLTGNAGGVFLVSSLSMTAHGDYGLNLFNSLAREVWKNAGLASYTLSFEMNEAQIRDAADGKSVMIAYGRLPFMVTENCIKHKTCGKTYLLVDRTGREFPVTCAPSCRNRIWNADRLYLADRPLPDVGAIRLLFTDETADEAERVIRAYTEKPFPMPEKGYTRGLINKKI